MNLCLVLISVVCVHAVVGSFSPVITDFMHSLEHECITTTGASLADIELVRKNRVVPNNEKMTDFAICMLKKHTVINPDGSVNQNIQEYIIPSDTNSVLLVAPTCIAQVGQDVRETSRNIMNCFLQSGEMVMATEPETTTTLDWL